MDTILPKIARLFSLVLLLLCFSSFSEALGQATVTTDKDDYAPGEYVIITGTGWQPGERVDFHFEETPKPETCSNSHDNYAIADPNGNIYYDGFLIKINHLGVHFVLTATGESSGRTAVTEFTDGNVQFRSSGLPNGISVSVTVTYTPATPSNATQITQIITFNSQSNGGVAAKDGTQIFWSFSNPSNYYWDGQGNYSQGFTVNGNYTGSNGILGTYLGCTTTSVTNPGDYNNTYGFDATFSVTGSGSGSLTYQWEEFNGAWTPISNGGIYSGATTNTLTLTTPGVALSGRRYRVVVTGACGSATSDGNATLTITPKTLTGAFTADNKVYDGTTSANVLGRILNGVLAGDVGNVSLSGGTATFATASVGNGKTVTLTGATLSGSAAGNYNLTSVGTTTANITPKSAIVTPDANTKEYGSADPALTGTLVGFLAGDNVTAVYSREAGETVLGGPYEISAELSPAGVLSNYDITYNTAEFTITTKSASVTPDANTKEYGSADPALTGTLV
ncbi:hypothetical protein SAMN04488519_1111, partial [Algoriphagus ornithinivorans]